MPALAGSFPYDSTATVRASGRQRKERIRPGAFRRSVENEYDLTDANARRAFERLEALRQRARDLLAEGKTPPGNLLRDLEHQRSNLEDFRAMPDINLLRGHNFDQPLAQRGYGSLVLEDTPEALRFTAMLPPLDEAPSYVADTVRMVTTGLLHGVSPGFRLPPASANPDAEQLVQDEGEDGILTRLITDAVLFELSLVTRPAYSGTVIEDGRAAIYPGEVEFLEGELEVRSALESMLPDRIVAVFGGPRRAGGADFEAALWL